MGTWIVITDRYRQCGHVVPIVTDKGSRKLAFKMDPQLTLGNGMFRKGWQFEEWFDLFYSLYGLFYSAPRFPTTALGLLFIDKILKYLSTKPRIIFLVKVWKNNKEEQRPPNTRLLLKFHFQKLSSHKRWKELRQPSVKKIDQTKMQYFFKFERFSSSFSIWKRRERLAKVQP